MGATTISGLDLSEPLILTERTPGVLLTPRTAAALAVRVRCSNATVRLFGGHLAERLKTLGVSADEVLRARGDRDHPLSRGYTSAKGRSLPKLHHHPRRLERPPDASRWGVAADIGHAIRTG
jgi:anaerobic selenocysteine-containing dehydrogenase